MTCKTIWRLSVVMAHTGLSRSFIYSKISLGEFPPPIKLGPRAVGWDSESIEAWIQSRIDASLPSVEA